MKDEGKQKKAWKDEREERFREEKERKREREEEEGKGKAGSGLDKRELGGGKTEREEGEKGEWPLLRIRRVCIAITGMEEGKLQAQN